MKSSKQVKREARQLFRQCLVQGVLDEQRARQATQLILATGRRDSRAILEHFLRLVKLDGARHTANIESATPLPPDLRATIEAGLKSRYGAGLSPTFRERPALIGGVRIQVGSDVYDGSVRAGLEALAKRF